MIQGMSIKLVCGACVVAIGLVGCGGTLPVNFDVSKSHALNYAKAGKVKSIKDFDLTQLQSDSIVGNWGSVTSRDYRPKQQTQSNLLFAWVPEDMVDSRGGARQVFSDVVASAIEDALFDLKVPHSMGNRSLPQQISSGYGYLFTSVSIEESNKGCPTWLEAKEDIDKTCLISSGVVSPRRNPIPTPEFVNSNQLAYVFDASNDLQYSDLELNFPAGAQLDRMEIIKKVSEYLPKWAFIYTPGRRVDSGEFTMPLVLNQGVVYPFKRP
jgi:hypothetical protein